MTSPLRVVQCGTGNTGSHALRFLLEDPTFEVVGVWVGRTSNVGKTASELAGLGSDGVPSRGGPGPRATQDVEDLVGLEADCVLYMAAEPQGSVTTPGTDGWESVGRICRFLAAGMNVVGTGISGLIYPPTYGTPVFDRLKSASQAGGTTFFGTGIEPGFMSDTLALALTSISRDVRSVRAQEMISYASYDQPAYHVSQGGIWGAPLDRRYADGFAARVLAAGMGAPILLLADALGLDLDDLTSSAEIEAIDSDLDLPMGLIRAGTIAGYRFEVAGVKSGTKVLALEHITRLDPAVAPNWPALDPGGFRVIVDGRPSFTTSVIFDQEDAAVAGCIGTAARAVNAIPIVVDAPSGVCSSLDLPAITARGSMA
jgi:2,4-diaminopentanoate dehydrogenase